MATTYTVVKGDTLWDISEKHLGNGSKYKDLAAINGIDNPDLIYIGQVIKLTDDGSTSKKSTDDQRVTINHFGLQADVDNTLFVTWSWSKESKTEHYKVWWEYYTRDKYWFTASNNTTQYKFSTYSIPDNATQVRVRVMPVSKTYTNTGGEKTYFSATWTSINKNTTHTVVRLPDPPGTPDVTLEDLKLTASLFNIKSDADIIYFEVTSNDKTVAHEGKAQIVTSTASHQWTVKAGNRYKVRCYAIKDDTLKSEWSDYSSNYETIPATPATFTKCEVASDNSIYLEWAAVENSTSYDIEYTTVKSNFDTPGETTTISNIEATQRKITEDKLTSGQDYFFRLRAVNSKASSEVKHSAWSEISSITIGEVPAAPTTWSSTTTAINDEALTLYWVHNSRDGSSQTFAEVELNINGTVETHTVQNSTDEEEKDKTSSYSVPMVDNDGDPYYEEGAIIRWRVRTAGVTKKYGDWSVERVVDIYARPELEFDATDLNGNQIADLMSFPIYISALAKPKTQIPIGYHITISADEFYETTDNMGNETVVNAGDNVYSKYFDISEDLITEISAGDVHLENGYGYKITCMVSMNSGLTAEATKEFTVSWTNVGYQPNAEIGIDTDTLSASIRPYCATYSTENYRVNVVDEKYILTTEKLGSIYEDTIRKTNEELIIAYGSKLKNIVTITGEAVYYGRTTAGATVYYCTVNNIYYKVDASEESVKLAEETLTTTGERVRYGTTTDGESVYFSVVETTNIVTDALMAVYRRENDGSFVELASGIDCSKYTSITDPHPALNYAKYRIVATDKTSGIITYYDIPDYPIGGKAAVIQWDEEWSTTDTPGSEDRFSQPSWTGSILKLPYNIDVSTKYQTDTAIVEYIGRKHPVSYYGTQLGETATWNVEIAKTDTETLYGLRRLAIWMGNVYVREPSGSGYWASVSVSFSQKHCEVTIPVTIEITRVEGGI